MLSFLLYFLIQRIEFYREAKDQARHEISERKEAEKERERLLSELSAKNEEMESFIYSVSHDLKTPIVTIDGFIGALKEDYGKVIGEKGQHFLSRITEGTRKMEGLINDLLELSRIGRVKEKKREVSFAELVKNAAREFHHQIEDRGIKIKVEDNIPPLFGEKKRLAQLVNNLISNAIKYIGKDNPDPLIEAGVIKKEEGPVYFIRDNGIGIDLHYYDKIFQIFQRLPDAKGIEGSGVGLTIAKRIIELHVGHIRVESKKGKGTTFFFTLKEKGG